jgi:hypothetical protein
MNGNVFVFSFSQEGWEAIVNLTEIDEQSVMAKMCDEKPKQTPDSILSMMELRARYNEHRRMEIWLVKLDDSFTEEDLRVWAEEDPQAVADLARMGTAVYPKMKTRANVIN